MRTILAALLALSFLSFPAIAVEPDEILKDPALEARARALSSGLRCLVCQNQSIDDSNAGLAKDLRVLLLERPGVLFDPTVPMGYIVSKYGDCVLLKPRFGFHTLFLWLGPFALLAIGIFVLMRMRTRPVVVNAETTLSDEEKKRVQDLMNE